MTALDDHRLAADLAQRAAKLLLEIKTRAVEDGYAPWDLESAGDLGANRLICDELARLRPEDAVLSEESRDDGRRQHAQRVWIVDPLDGSYDFGAPMGVDYAVHVGLVEDKRPIAAAVALPESGLVFATDDPPPDDPGRESPIIISGRSTAGMARNVAHMVGGTTVIAGSAGVKAMAVVQGLADVYLHASGLYEWDACAPAAVAEAAGLTVLDLDGKPLEYNQEFPAVRGLIIGRSPFVEQVIGLFA